MTWPVVELAFWDHGDAGSAALDALVADGNAPLARLGIAAIAAAYADEHDVPMHSAQRRWADHVAAKSLAVDGALTEVVPTLDAADVPFFVAKGPAMTDLYSSQRLRGYTDLDVYVPSESLAPARAALAARGYAPVAQRKGPLGGQPRELHGGRYSAVVEVHSDVIDNLQRRWLPPITAYLPFVERRRILGMSVPVLPPAAHLCVQAIHLGAGHRYARLSCYRDIALLAPAADDELAEALGARPYLRAAFAVLASWGRDVPAIVGGGGATHRCLVAALGRDPLRWDEFRPSAANVFALANQATWLSGLTATLAAGRALLPERGRRASVAHRPHHVPGDHARSQA